MRITEIAKDKGKCYTITLEDGCHFRIHADLLQDAALHIGDDCPPEKLAEIRHRAAEHRAYEYGLYLLENRSYSYREMYDKLTAAPETEEEAVLTALEKLTRYGFLNDARYAEQLARHYVEGKKYGLRRAQFEMQHKGLAQEDIENALAEYDEPEKISAILLELLDKKYARQLHDPDDRKAIEKVTAALMRRGFRYQDIRYAIEDYFSAI